MSNHIKELYNSRILKLGATAESVGWRDEEQQLLRFDLLTASLQITNSATILDLGCGYGALLGYINNRVKHYNNAQYCGVDISENMIESATKINPTAKFICSNFDDVEVAEFDYIIMSGALNIKNNENANQRIGHFLNKFYPLCKRALSFNLVHDRVDFMEGKLEHYNISDVSNLISTHTREFYVRSTRKLWEDTYIVLKD